MFLMHVKKNIYDFTSTNLDKPKSVTHTRNAVSDSNCINKLRAARSRCTQPQSLNTPQQFF